MHALAPSRRPIYRIFSRVSGKERFFKTVRCYIIIYVFDRGKTRCVDVESSKTFMAVLNSTGISPIIIFILI